MKLVVALLCSFLLMLMPATALYADITIDVDQAGLVSISGLTDNDDLLVKDSPEFTSKKGKYWVVNVTYPGVYSDLVYRVELPKGSVVNYMRLPSFGQIEEDNGFVIHGAAQNAPLTFIIQYQIEPDDRNRLFVFVFMAILVFVGAFFFIVRKKKEKPIPSFNLQDFPDRQQEILTLLLKHKGRLSQAKLEKLTGLPKSSLSRNIDSLVRKGVVEKVGQGMSNLVKIK